MLSDNIYDYYNVSQGKVTVPNMDDGEEFQLADVSAFSQTNQRLYTPHIHTQTNINFPFHKEDKTQSSLSRGNFHKIPLQNLRTTEQVPYLPLYPDIQISNSLHYTKFMCVLFISISVVGCAETFAYRRSLPSVRLDGTPARPTLLFSVCFLF